MGRRVIWSDPQIQKLSREFVCVIEECFFLFPQAHVTSPPNPESTRLFQAYVKNAPPLWPANTTTHQGLYVMTPGGDYLAGKFARQSKENALSTLQEGWNEWTQQKSGDSQAVPGGTLPLFGGKVPTSEVVKLRVSYRDLPRGDLQRPGDARFPNPYNISWYDLSAEQAAHFTNSGSSPQSVLADVLKPLAMQVLKDAVRGQIRGWQPDAWRGGELTVRMIEERDGLIVCELRGSCDLQNGALRYRPKLYGETIYDRQKGQFTAFQLMAAGQREGKGAANGRETDLGPAPMGVALSLFP
ncbi:MAG: hypothetical protein AAF226_12570 [Verrucomicrobiota bacterium]